jgi:hypothetical protein
MIIILYNIPKTHIRPLRPEPISPQRPVPRNIPRPEYGIFIYCAFLKILLSGSKWPRVVVSTIDLNTVLKEWNNVSTKRSLTREVQAPLKKRDSIEVIKNNDFISNTFN